MMSTEQSLPRCRHIDLVFSGEVLLQLFLDRLAPCEGALDDDSAAEERRRAYESPAILREH